MKIERMIGCGMLALAIGLAGCPPPERTPEYQETPEVREQVETFENDYVAPQPPYDEPVEPDTMPPAAPRPSDPDPPPRR